MKTLLIYQFPWGHEAYFSNEIQKIADAEKRGGRFKCAVEWGELDQAGSA